MTAQRARRGRCGARTAVRVCIASGWYGASSANGRKWYGLMLCAPPHTAKIGSNELLNWGNEKYSDKQYEGFRHLKAISAFVYDSQLAL